MTAASRKLADAVVWLLDSGDAHLSPGEVLRGFPERRAGERPPGFAHSAWQLLEHLRLAQDDIIRYCVDPKYRSLEFPEGLWPKGPEPPSHDAWRRSARAFLGDVRKAERLVRAKATRLLASLPHAKGITWLDEMLLIADHNAYHLGQLVQLRKVLESRSAGRRGRRRSRT